MWKWLIDVKAYKSYLYLFYFNFLCFPCHKHHKIRLFCDRLLCVRRKNQYLTMALELSWAHMSPSTLQYSVKPIQAKNLLRLILKYYTSRTVKDRCSLRFWARVQLPGLNICPHTHHTTLSLLINICNINSFLLFFHLNPPKNNLCVLIPVKVSDF